MRRLLHTTTAALLLFAFTAHTTVALSHSDTPKDGTVTLSLKENSKITVLGTSNVRDWEMTVTDMTGTFVLRDVDTNRPSSALQFDQVRMRIPVDGLQSGQGSMDKKAHKALKKDAYPTIHFDAVQTDVRIAESDGTIQVRSEGRLIVAGNQHNIMLELEGTRLDDGSFRFQGTKDLRFSELGLERPTAMLGALRVADEFTIEFDVILGEES